MPSINTCYVQGFVTRPPEIRYVGSGVALASFALAHNRNYQRNGEWQKETSFVDVKCWGDLAERASSELAKGANVIVAGRLSQERWTTRDGAERSKLVVIADRIDAVSAPTPKPPARDSRPQADDDDLPF